MLALLAGAVVGIALGALGGGGGMLAVPAFTYLLGASPAAAGTASLLVVSAAAALALLGHLRAGRVRLRAGLLFAAAGVLPSAGAGLLSSRVPDVVLTAAFAVVTAVSGLVMLRGPEPAAPSDRGSTGAALGAGAGVGVVTGFLGVGGGFLVVPALVRALGLGMRAAIGTSLVVVVANAVTALAARVIAHPQLPDLAVLAPFAGAALLGAWDGRRLAARLSEATLRRVFGSALLIVALAMTADALLG